MQYNTFKIGREKDVSWSMDMFSVEVTSMATEQFGDAINIVKLGKNFRKAASALLNFFQQFILFHLIGV